MGNNCTIEEGAVVRRSILWDGATVMKETWLDRCVVGANCRVQSNAAVFDGVIVSPHRNGSREKSETK
jgi:NDP-sugar pyrophosphorylase family protein